MNKLYAVKVKRTVTTETMLIVSAPDKYEATDAAHDFAAKNVIAGRSVPIGTELTAYAADTFEVHRAEHVDVEV